MEQRYILFRSDKIHSTESGSNYLTHRGRGSDFSDIWPYIVGDDTRDISWRHSARTDTIQRKMRIEEDAFPISIIQTIDISHGFYTEDVQKSTSEYARDIHDTIISSARKYHYKSEESILEKVKHKKNSMIFYITSSLEVEELALLRGLAQSNDLILLHVFHPYELDPDSWLLFGWFWLNAKRYQQEFENKRKEVERLMRSIDAWYLLLTTDMHITPRINQFFKNRFS